MPKQKREKETSVDMQKSLKEIPGTPVEALVTSE